MQQPADQDERSDGERFAARVEAAVGLRSSLRPAAATEGARRHEDAGPDRRPAARRLTAFGVASSSVALLLVVALTRLGQPSPLPAPTSPVPTASPAPSGSSQPSALPAGVVTMDTGYALRAVPSPSGGYIAVADAGNAANPATVTIFLADGTPVESHLGADVAWTDDESLLIYDPAPKGGAVLYHRIGDPAGDVAFTDSYGGILGGGGGLIALRDAGPASDAAPGYRIWSNHTGLQAHELGVPLAWSPDGQLLAVWRQSTTAPTGTANPSPGVLTVRSGATSEPTGITGVPAFASPVSFSPSGTQLAATAPTGTPDLVDVQSGQALHLWTGATVEGWTPDGLAVVMSANGGLETVAADGRQATLPITSAWLSYGFMPGELATVTTDPSGQGGASVTIQRDASSTTFHTLGPATVTWLPRGVVCFVEGGTDDAQLMHDVLYRVALQ